MSLTRSFLILLVVFFTAGEATQQPAPQEGAPAPPAGRSVPIPPGGIGPKEGGRGDAPLPETKPIVWAAGKTRVLMVGGGSSHPYGTVYKPLDTAILEAAGDTVNYTEDRETRRRSNSAAPTSRCSA